MADHAHKQLALYSAAKKIDVSLCYRRALIASSLPNLGLDKARPQRGGTVPLKKSNFLVQYKEVRIIIITIS